MELLLLYRISYNPVVERIIRDHSSFLNTGQYIFDFAVRILGKIIKEKKNIGNFTDAWVE